VTRDEIKLVAFILGALLIGALVQHLRPLRTIPSATTPAPKPGGWAKPPYVLKENKSRSAPTGDTER
jgi:hypothetical protein